MPYKSSYDICARVKTLYTIYRNNFLTHSLQHRIDVISFSKHYYYYYDYKRIKVIELIKLILMELKESFVKMNTLERA